MNITTIVHLILELILYVCGTLYLGDKLGAWLVSRYRHWRGQYITVYLTSFNADEQAELARRIQEVMREFYFRRVNRDDDWPEDLEC